MGETNKIPDVPLSTFGKVPSKDKRTLHPYDENTGHVLTPGEVNDVKYVPPYSDQPFTALHPPSEYDSTKRSFSSTGNAIMDENFHKRYGAPSSLSSTGYFQKPYAHGRPDIPNKFAEGVSLRNNVDKNSVREVRVAELSPPTCRSFSSTMVTRDLRRAATELDPSEDHLLVNGKRLGDYLTGRAIGRISLNETIPQKDHQTFLNFGGKKRKTPLSAFASEEPRETTPVKEEEPQEREADDGDLTVTDWTSTNTLSGVSFSNTLHGFPSVKEYEPVPGLRPTVCRMCKRYSQFLPQPNMCSMCIARARLIRERNQINEYERDKNLYWQKVHEQNDASAFDEDKKALETSRSLRVVVDERNMNHTQQRTLALTTKSRDPDIDEALTTGIVKCTDPFDSRPDEAEDAEKKKKYRDSLIKQRQEDNERKHKYDKEEKEYGERARERELELLNETKKREEEDKLNKQHAQQRGLDDQVVRGRKFIPAICGYSPEGDPFTIRDNEDKEEQKARAVANKNVLLWQQKDIAERKKRKAEKDREDAALAAEMEKEMLDREVEELLAKDQEMKEKQARELKKQVTQKRDFTKTRELEGEKDGTVPYYPDGDPFTQHESPEKVRQRKFEKDEKNHQALKKQVCELVLVIYFNEYIHIIYLYIISLYFFFFIDLLYFCYYCFCCFVELEERKKRQEEERAEAEKEREATLLGDAEDLRQDKVLLNGVVLLCD
jgi:hypothetical protein